MKKLLLIVAIALCVSASVFADGFIGAEAGAGINWMKYGSDDNGKTDISVISFTAGAAEVLITSLTTLVLDTVLVWISLNCIKEEILIIRKRPVRGKASKEIFPFSSSMISAGSLL